MTIRADTTTAELRPQDRLFVWLEFKYAKPQQVSDNGKKTYLRSLNHYLVDCASGRLKNLQSLDYAANGDVVNSHDVREESVDWKPVAPETVGETIVGLCKRKALFDGSYNRALKEWKDSLASQSAQRFTGCRDAEDALLKKVCKEFRRLELMPVSKMTAKNFADYGRASEILDSAFVLKMPPLPHIS